LARRLEIGPTRENIFIEDRWHYPSLPIYTRTHNSEYAMLCASYTDPLKLCNLIRLD